MMWLKSCPRCKGDLYAGDDQFGPYICCAQCGHCLTQAQRQALIVRTVRPGEQKVRRMAANQ